MIPGFRRFRKILPSRTAAQNGHAVGVEEQAVKDVDDDHIQDGVRRENRSRDGNPEKSRVGVHGHQVIETALVPRDPENHRKKEPESR